MSGEGPKSAETREPSPAAPQLANRTQLFPLFPEQLDPIFLEQVAIADSTGAALPLGPNGTRIEVEHDKPRYGDVITLYAPTTGTQGERYFPTAATYDMASGAQYVDLTYEGLALRLRPLKYLHPQQIHQ
jgi:hypothetical protein